MQQYATSRHCSKFTFDCCKWICHLYMYWLQMYKVDHQIKAYMHAPFNDSKLQKYNLSEKILVGPHKICRVLDF